MKGLLLVILGASVQGAHEPSSAPSPLPTLGARKLDVQVSERWQLRVVAAEMRVEGDSWHWDLGLRDTPFTLGKRARFQTQDTASPDGRALGITRSYSEVRSKIDLECGDPFCGRGAIRGDSDCSWTTLRYQWNADLGEYTVTRVTDGGAGPLPDPVPGADEGLRALVTDPASGQAAAPIDLPLLLRHWRASDPRVTHLTLDMDPQAPAQQLALLMSAAIDALPRLEGLQGGITEDGKLRTESVREYRLTIQTESDTDVSRQVVERQRGQPGWANRLGVQLDTAHIDASIRGNLRVTTPPKERVPSSIRMEGEVTLELDASGPFALGPFQMAGRAELHLSLAGTLEREFLARTE
jgi:hypothetical protein